MSRAAAQQLRIGDLERDQTLEELSQHFVAGRLDVDELEERSGDALRARTQADLDRILGDLPGQYVQPVADQVKNPRGTKIVASAVCAALLGVLTLMGAAAADEGHHRGPMMTCDVSGQQDDCDWPGPHHHR